MFLWVRRGHADNWCCRSLQTVWSGQICFRRFPVPADHSYLFWEVSDLSALATAQLSLWYDCNRGDGNLQQTGRGGDCLKHYKQRINAIYNFCDVMGGGRGGSGIERQNMDENMEDWVSIDLGICSQLMTSRSLLTDTYLNVVPLSPTKSVSFTEVDCEIYISGSFLEKKGLQRKCMRITCIQKGNFSWGQT